MNKTQPSTDDFQPNIGELPNPSLQDQLAQKEAELEATKKGLETISYTISHDLRAPLRTIDNFSAALTEDFASQLPEEALNHISRIRKATFHMKGMIDELLELARVNRRKMELRDINVSRLARDIVEELSMEDPGRNVEFIIGEKMHISGDKHLLKIALHHLLHNAWKFTQNQTSAKIEISSEAQNGNVVFTIKDNGCGFDMNYYNQLFEPFKRLHSDKEFGGMGVGLTIAKQIIDRHHGKIWADSDINQGATFCFSLGKEYLV